jgi:hypothetical protein
MCKPFDSGASLNIANLTIAHGSSDGIESFRGTLTEPEGWYIDLRYAIFQGWREVLPFGVSL